jgi:hypothetical protein
MIIAQLPLAIPIQAERSYHVLSGASWAAQLVEGSRSWNLPVAPGKTTKAAPRNHAFFIGLDYHLVI